MPEGLFITIEGPDGAGKSTQIEYLRGFFDELGREVLFTREPGGTEISEKLREIILDPENGEMSPRAEALLYAASRAQLVDEVIRPALDSGRVVICDRFIDSSYAYQGAGRGLGDDVWTINEFAVSGVMPDITFFMALPPSEGRKRLDQGNLDRLESEAEAFHEKVYKGYLDIAKRYPDRIRVIDALRDREEIREEIKGLVMEIMEKRGN